jgi:L-fuculose-phosphate aldolase
VNTSIINDILEVSKAMYNKGMVDAYCGNVSVREGDRVYVTPSNVCKGYLKPGMIVAVTLEGDIVQAAPGYKPSSEVKMHLAAYALRGDITSVIHTHAPYATAHAIACKPIETRSYTEMIVGFDKIPVASYGTPSTDEIHAGFAEVIHQTDVFLIAHHGIVSVGKDVYDAMFKMESIEAIAKALVLARSLGGEMPLPGHRIDELYAVRKKFFGKDRMP